MAYSSSILLGKITKLSGYEGVVLIKLDKYFSEDILKLESVFLEIEGRPVPFFVTYVEYGGADSLKLSFDGYESEDKVKEFVGCRVFLTSGMDFGLQQEETDIIEGYQVYVKDDKSIGTVTRITQNSGQWLLSILSPERKELLVPLHEDFIVSIDREKRIIIMDIPDGLTEING